MSISARAVDLGSEVPIGVVELELGGDLAHLHGSFEGVPWVAAVVVVRLHSVPLGMFVVDLRDQPDGVAPAELRALVMQELGQAVEEHLSADGPADPPACQVARTRLLADAPTLSVIIPTRDRAARLPLCLDSILGCTYPADRLEIVVVDNVPRDDSTRLVVERYAAAGHPVRYAREDAPGSASARNGGLAVVTNDLVVFTDDDARVDTWWLAELALAFQAHPGAAAVTGMLLPTDLETMAQLWFEQYGGFSRGWDERVFTLDRSSDPDGLLYPYAAGIFGTGNNMAFRRTSLAYLGNFDPALGNGTPALGGVDSEVLQRTVLCGFPLLYAPRALVWHSHRRDYEDLKRQVNHYGAGLTAYLLKALIRNPHLLVDFARRVPAGARFAFSSTSEKNARKQADYPSDLTGAERRGMLYGLIAYPRSRRAMGPHVTPRALRPR